MPDVDVVIAGLGAHGSAAAWRCAVRGLRVLGLDARRPPHAVGSSHGGTRIIRETALEGAAYVPLVRRAFELWDELPAPARPRLTGAVYAGPADGHVVGGSRASALAHGVPHEVLDAGAARARFPAFAVPEGAVALVERRGGWLDPEACVQACLDAASARGAELRFDQAVTGWRAGPGGVEVATTGGTLRAATLVLATGAWMVRELAAVGVAAAVERQVQHWFTPRDIAAVADMPVSVWQGAEVSYVLPPVRGVVKIGVHHDGETAAADTVRRDVHPDEIARARSVLARIIPAAAGAHVRSAVCLYTNSPDGHFVLGPHARQPRVLLASCCSGFGFKFATAVGESLAAWAAGAEPDVDLRFCSPARFG